MSGASTLRPGYQKLLEDARKGTFDVVVAEALDRLSRDQEDTAALFKQLSFAGVSIVTLAEGEISELHVGLKGTMNALFLKDLALKTRRGMEGRVRQGMSGGGNAYGYEVVRQFAADGTPQRGRRRIDDAEAAIVRRIFEEFAKGSSPRAIAHGLNRDKVPGPFGGTWSPSTIYGNWRRGTGILNNELYAGHLVWSRQRFIKDPLSGKRQARMNPEAQWIRESVPELRIVDEVLWDRVKAQQQASRSAVMTAGRGVRSERARRPSYLLSGLLKCGACGGGFTIVGRDHYGCAAARDRGTCDNHLTIRRGDLETAVLDGMKHQLMHPDKVKEFVATFHQEFNRIAAGRDGERQRIEQDLEKAKRDLKRLVEAIKAGVSPTSIRDEMGELEARRADLEARLGAAPKPAPRIHPNLAEVYRRKVADLANALQQEDARAEAATALRGLIEEIRLVPVDGKLTIELLGELSALIDLGTNKHPRTDGPGVQLTLVAGARFELTTFRL